MPKISELPAHHPLRKRHEKLQEEIGVFQCRVARLLVILLMCVHPLYFNAEKYFHLTRHKFVFFMICVGVVLLLVAIIWAARMTRTPRLLPQDKLHVVDVAILGFAAVTLISALLSPFRSEINVWIGITEPGGRYDGAITQLAYVAVFFVVSRWYRPRTNDFVVFGISASIVALIGILQFYNMDFLGLWPIDDERFAADNLFNIFFRSTLGNTNIVSTYVCVAILLCGFLYIKIRPRPAPEESQGDEGAAAGTGTHKLRLWKRLAQNSSAFRQYLWLAASALNFWLMDLADADSGRVGVLAVMLVAIPFIVETRRTLGKTLILGASWLAAYTAQNLLYDVMVLQARTILSLIPYAAAAVLLFAGGIFLVVWGKGREPGPNDPVKWKLGVIIIGVCLVAGIAGVEFLGRQDAAAGGINFVYEAREMLHGRVRDEFGTNRVYIWRNALQALPKNPVIGSGPDTFGSAFPGPAHMRYGEYYSNAHNEYIQILICQGILGIVFYLCFHGGLILRSVGKAFRNPMLMAALAAFAGYCAQSLFNLSTPICSPMLWVLAGLLGSERVRE